MSSRRILVADGRVSDKARTSRSSARSSTTSIRTSQTEIVFPDKPPYWYLPRSTEPYRVKVSCSALQASTQTQTIPIYSNAQVSIGQFGAGATSPLISPKITWDASKWQLQSATLNMTAQQTSGNGADVRLLMNGTVALDLSWPFLDTSTKTGTADVVGLLDNGVNDFQINYTVAFIVPPLTTDTATVTASITLVFMWIGSGTPPTSPPASYTPPSIIPSVSFADIMIVLVLAALLAGIGGFFFLRLKRPRGTR